MAGEEIYFISYNAGLPLVSQFLEWQLPQQFPFLQVREAQLLRCCVTEAFLTGPVHYQKAH